MKQYCFTVDDNLRCLQELSQGDYSSIFEYPYFAMYKRLHERFDLKVQLNLFYENPKFNLSEMSDRFKDEWKSNSDWLKMSFHSRLENFQPYIESGYDEVYEDCRAVNSEIVRFAGEEALAKTTTIHYCYATQEGLNALKDNGVKGLLGLFGTRVSYLRTPEQCDILRTGEVVRDGGISYAMIDAVLNNLKKDEILPTVVRYVSLFAGVEAFSVASSRIAGARWEAVFFSEIDPFPCAVLAHRFPGVPNLGDVSKIKVREGADGRKEITNGSTSIPFPDGGIDILAGGSPCQDVSLAGLRRGFADGTRSSLAFEYARLVGELRPRVLLWENVAGVLSSRGGRDFAALLRRLDELGYGLAWRVLDVQWTRVDGPMPGGGWGGFPRAIPQRRERVWLVGLAGAPGTSAAEILFERYGVPGHSPPRREAGKGFAAPPGYCPALAAQARGGAGEAQRGGVERRQRPAQLRRAGDGLQDARRNERPAEDCAGTLCADDGRGLCGQGAEGRIVAVPLGELRRDGLRADPAPPERRAGRERPRDILAGGGIPRPDAGRRS